MSSDTNPKTDELNTRLLHELYEAESKAFDAMSRYKFQIFGCWAAIWVHLNRIGNFKRPNPFQAFIQNAKIEVKHRKSTTGGCVVGDTKPETTGSDVDRCIECGARPAGELCPTCGCHCVFPSPSVSEAPNFHEFVGIGAGELGMTPCKAEGCGALERDLIHADKFRVSLANPESRFGVGAVYTALHTLWTKAVEQEGYIKAEWRDLDDAIQVALTPTSDYQEAPAVDYSEAAKKIAYLVGQPEIIASHIVNLASRSYREGMGKGMEAAAKIADEYVVGRKFDDHWRKGASMAALDIAAKIRSRMSQPAPKLSAILDFQAWAECWCKDNGRKLTQTEYGIAMAAFYAAHPTEGPFSAVMQPAPVLQGEVMSDTKITEDDLRVARELVAHWKEDIGRVVRYKRIEADIACALAKQRETDAKKCDNLRHQFVLESNKLEEAGQFGSATATDNKSIGAELCAASIRTLLLKL